MKSNKIFFWIALTTGVILLIPLIAMQVSNEWDWNLFDFVIIGTLIFGMGSLFVLTARKVHKKKHRITLGFAFAALLLYFYAELAVGIFTNLGS